MQNNSDFNKEKIESSIPKWVVFSLLFITTLIIVSIIRAYLSLLMSGIAMLFIWTQITKEKAEIKMQENIDNRDPNQLNLFHNKQKTEKDYAHRLIAKESRKERKRRARRKDIAA